VQAEARSSSGSGWATGPGYVPVAFRGAGNVPGAARETLMKASMPVDREARPVSPTAVKHRRSSQNAVLRRSRQSRAGVQRVRGWVVLTSWDGTERPGMVLSGVQERVISISYAAVPTAGGWLVIQL
jgi:hypothetical protein